MELLDILIGSSKINTSIPCSDICQPFKYNTAKKTDPYFDMIDLEAYLNNKEYVDESKYTADIFQVILFVLDGTIQLHSFSEILKRANAFKTSLYDEVKQKTIFKKNKIKIHTKKINNICDEIKNYEMFAVSEDLLHSISLFIERAITIIDDNKNVIYDIGWSTYPNGFILKFVNNNGFVIIEDDIIESRILTTNEKDMLMKMLII